MPRPSVTLRDLPSATRAVYVGVQILLHLLIPVALLLILIRARREPAHLRHLSHRLGLGPVGPQGAIWIYAASLGETRAASPLIRHLLAEGRPVILSHMSPAGMAEGHRLFPDTPGLVHRYVPLDLFWAVRLFLSRARPAALVILEIELWPALIVESVRRGVPVFMANGNLLDRSMGDLRGLRRHLMRLYLLFSQVFTRTPAFAGRYRRVGVAEDRISVVGEMKYDQWIDPAHVARGLALRAGWPGAERVLMIASSVKDEEPLLLSMVTALLAADPGLRIVWVPRSPQRFDAVAEAVAALGPVRRSALGLDMAGPLPPAARVLVGDSTGEMNAYYPMADLVFVGASLVDHGGHNIMEPMALGRPVVMGPSTYGIAFAAGPAAEAGAFESLPDAAALQARIAALLADPARLAAMSAAATAYTATQTGAAAATARGILQAVGEKGAG